MANKKKIAAGIAGVAVVGAALGVAAKLLKDPKNRKLLADKIGDVKKLTGETVEHVKKQLPVISENTKKK